MCIFASVNLSFVLQGERTDPVCVNEDMRPIYKQVNLHVSNSIPQEKYTIDISS